MNEKTDWEALYCDSPLSPEQARSIALSGLTDAINNGSVDEINLWGLRARSAGADISTILEPAE